MGLLELIVKTGIANAINSQLGGLKGNKDAIAETIENNVRSKIIKEHLTDPAYYERMSALLDEIIGLRKASHRVRGIPEARGVAGAAGGGRPGPPGSLQQPQTGRPPLGADGHVAQPPAGDSLTGDPVLDLAVKLDETVKRVRPDGWRGVQARELKIKDALYKVLDDASEVERIFTIIEAQSEY